MTFMGLTITRTSGPHDKEPNDMATTAEVRVYRTVNGELVGEGDPRGAFLAYAIGSEVDSSDVAAYRELRDSRSLGARAQVDEVARDEARMRQAADPAHARPAPGQTPALIHDPLATELADEARMLANHPEQERVAAVREDMHGRPVADRRLARTADGELVAETDPRGAVLAYTPGMEIQDADLDAYAKMTDKGDGAEESDSAETSDGDGNPADDPDGETKSADPPANKAAPAPANKAAAKPRGAGK